MYDTTVCREAVKQGYTVTSLSRSGSSVSPVEGVTYKKCDVFDRNSWEKEVNDNVHGVISCIGTFGTNEFMRKINGDVNVFIAENTKNIEKPVIAFGFVSI